MNKNSKHSYKNGTYLNEIIFSWPEKWSENPFVIGIEAVTYHKLWKNWNKK